MSEWLKSNICWAKLFLRAAVAKQGVVGCISERGILNIVAEPESQWGVFSAQCTCILDLNILNSVIMRVIIELQTSPITTNDKGSVISLKKVVMRLLDLTFDP